MPTVQLFSATDMLTGQSWRFAASSAGLSGTVDGAVQTRNGAQQLLISGLAEDAAAVQGVLARAQSRPEFYASLLRGDDTITGCAQPELPARVRDADTLDGIDGGGLAPV